MKAIRAAAVLLALLAATLRGADDFIDTVDDALSVSAWQDNLRARLSGSVDVEGYRFQQPAPSLYLSGGDSLFNPRLSLFLDAQAGAHVYVFAQARADRRFDPANSGAEFRLDEYALRLTPWDDGRFNLQIGQFATVVGNWTLRHDSWDNPLVTAPLLYENLTGIWDIEAVHSCGTLLLWANVGPRPSAAFPNKTRGVPIIWGPSYGTGASASGVVGKFAYAAEIKNTSLSSRPETWSVAETQWSNPTFSGRVGFMPDGRWNLGFSASTGAYLQPAAQPSVAPGSRLGAYRETLFGQDASFAWHHLQLWSEVYAARFAIPRVGDADTLGYYVEGKFKFTPQLFGALRWNQQRFSTVLLAAGGSGRWGSDIWRIDAGPGFRFTPHTQLKLQYSIQDQDSTLRNRSGILAVQFTARF